jgi:hypothetical protein
MRLTALRQLVALDMPGVAGTFILHVQPDRRKFFGKDLFDPLRSGGHICHVLKGKNCLLPSREA